jgi:hypothetical protein
MTSKKLFPKEFHHCRVLSNVLANALAEIPKTLSLRGTKQSLSQCISANALGKLKRRDCRAIARNEKRKTNTLCHCEERSNLIANVLTPMHQRTIKATGLPRYRSQ